MLTEELKQVLKELDVYGMNYEIQKNVLETGNINYRCGDEKKGATLLSACVIFNLLDLAKLLIQNGADVDLIVQEGKSAVDLAFEMQNREIYDLFKNAKQIREEYIKLQKEKTLEQEIEEDKYKSYDELVAEARDKFAKILKK